ncbi:MAG TPA: IclR family transcriptional regulator [Anaerolineales bacterium]
MNDNDTPVSKNEQLLTIHRALNVLEYLSQAGRPVRLMEISEAVGLPKSQIHRILSTLLSRNYVRQSPITRLYSLGFATWMLSRSMDYARTLVDIARPVLDDLRSQTQETAFLSVLYGKSVLYLYTAMSPNPSHVYFQSGSQVPVHACASGKAMLAAQPREYLDELFDNGLERYTEYTITDKALLRQELDRIQQQGFAIEDQEANPEMAAVAASLPISRENDLAGVGLFLPSVRLQEQTQEALVARVITARDQILHRLEGS